jgi:hypothetical protein
VPGSLAPLGDAGSTAVWARGLELLGFVRLNVAPLFLPAFVALVLMWRWPSIRGAWWLSLFTVGILLLGRAPTSPDVRLVLLLPFTCLLAQEGYAWIVQRMLQVGQGMRHIQPAMLALPLALGLFSTAHGPGVAARLRLDAVLPGPPGEAGAEPALRPRPLSPRRLHQHQ